MPLFVMIARDGSGSREHRDALREKHVVYFQNLFNAGKIVFAGPIRDESDERSVGAVIIFEALDLNAAWRIIEQDPYVMGHVFATITVEPTKQVFPPPTS